eukprot:SAG22_NODE_1715_length_3747_cov_2.226700_5_plen_112_part_00
MHRSTALHGRARYVVQDCNSGPLPLRMSSKSFPVCVLDHTGHDDGVGLDHWVGYEYAKIRRGYTKLGLPASTEIEWFDGPHTIHGEATFAFLHRHLRWHPDDRGAAPSAKL